MNGKEHQQIPLVMLVEDHWAPAAQFEQLDGITFQPYRTAEGAVAALRRGYRPNIAFVDFDLGAGVPTGLSVAQELRETSPETRIVVYTTLSDGGRILFAVAAHQWFGASQVLDKASASDETLKNAIRGVDVTLPNWRISLQQSGYLINGLFKNAGWVDLWRVWDRANGNRASAKSLVGDRVTKTMVEEFYQQSLEPMEAFRDQFLPVEAVLEPSRTYQRRQTPTVAFAHANSKFFHAVDLPAAVDYAKPWKRLEYNTGR